MEKDCLFSLEATFVVHIFSPTCASHIWKAVLERQRQGFFCWQRSLVYFGNISQDSSCGWNRISSVTHQIPYNKWETSRVCLIYHPTYAFPWMYLCILSSTPPDFAEKICSSNFKYWALPGFIILYVFVLKCRKFPRVVQTSRLHMTGLFHTSPNERYVLSRYTEMVCVCNKIQKIEWRQYSILNLIDLIKIANDIWHAQRDYLE